MRVVYDHQIFQAQPYGGISRYFYELISRAVEAPGFEICLYLGWHLNRYGLERFAPLFKAYSGSPRPNIPKSAPIFSLLNRIGFSRFCKAVAPEIYHQTYYAHLAPRFSGRRVLTVYDMIHEVHPEHFSKSDPTTAMKRAAVEKADAILAISESTKQDLMRLFRTPEKKIRVIPLANSLRVTPPAARPIADPYILYVGSREGYKNFPLALRAFCSEPKLYRDHRLVCFGGGPLNPEELSVISGARIPKDRVIQLGGADEVLAGLYQHAEVFVYPSLYEGFGLPPLEAMHYGCPVLVGKTSSLPEVVGDAGAYFEPNSEGDFRDKLLGLLANAHLRAHYREKGFAREADFSWDRCFQETAEVYRSL